MNREYHRWFSPNLNREMELLVFGHEGAKVLVFPTRQGRFYDYEDWGLVGAVREKIDGGYVQLFCVDSVDSESLYGTFCSPEAKIAKHNRYEHYILNEVVPLMRSRAADPFLMTHGCSIGAYHAVNIAFRHPAIFRKVVALSGRFDLTQPTGPFEDLFQGHYDRDVYFHTPVHFIPGLRDPNYLDPLSKMQIVLAVGEADPFVDSNRDLSRKLWDKGIQNVLSVWDGVAHRAKAWREMVPHYL